MSSVDWSIAPYGTMAHVHCYGEYNAGSGPVRHDSFCRWVGRDGRLGLDSLETNAPTFGTRPGTVTIRPSTAEAELRIKADMWKSIHDDLFNVAEQIKSERDKLRAEVARLKDTDLQVRRCEALLGIRNKLQEKKDALTAERDKLRAEVERLRSWKESATKVMDSIDLQKVGNLISVGLGEDIGPRILPALLELKAGVDSLKQQSQGEAAITDLLLAHIGLDESAAFTESGVPNPGKLQAILKDLK